MEALLPEEALEDDFKSFDMAVRVLTLKDYDYLDFRDLFYKHITTVSYGCCMISCSGILASIDLCKYIDIHGASIKLAWCHAVFLKRASLFCYSCKLQV
jgi:hypothetical protein